MKRERERKETWTISNSPDLDEVEVHVEGLDGAPGKGGKEEVVEDRCHHRAPNGIVGGVQTG